MTTILIAALAVFAALGAASAVYQAFRDLRAMRALQVAYASGEKSLEDYEREAAELIGDGWYA